MSSRTVTVLTCDACHRQVDRFMWEIDVTSLGKGGDNVTNAYELCSVCSGAIHDILFPKGEVAVELTPAGQRRGADILNSLREPPTVKR